MVLFHAGLWPLRSGFVGVDVFFVISGFLLGGIIYRESLENRFSFLDFYARRARRILPALGLVLLSTLAFGALLLAPAEYARLGSTAAYVSLAISNVHFSMVISYFTPEAALDPLLMTWSLAVEEQFYVLFPILVIACLRLSPRALLPALLVISAFSFAVCLRLTESDRTAAFYLLPSRAWELGAGAALAVATARTRSPVLNTVAEPLSVIGMLGLLVSVVAFDEAAALPGWRVGVPVFATIAVISARQSRLNRTVIGSAPLVWVGRRSYSWYLWHWPILAFVRISTVGDPAPTIIASAVAASFVAAVLSLHFVEDPLRRRRLSSKAVLFRYAVAVAAVAALSMGIRVGQGLPVRTPPIVDGLFTESKGGACVVYQGVAEPNTQDPCVAPAGGTIPVVGLIGDSHAGALSPGLIKLASQRGWRVDVMAKASCPPLLDANSGQSDVSGCLSFNRSALKVFSENPAVRVVFLAAYWDAARGGYTAAADKFERDLARSVAKLKSAGKRVYIIEDAPTWQSDPARWTASQLIPARRWISRLSGQSAAPSEDVAGVRETHSALARVAATSGAKLLSLRTGICDPACGYYDVGGMLYTDKHHLSARGSEVALSPIISSLQE